VTVQDVSKSFAEALMPGERDIGLFKIVSEGGVAAACAGSRSSPAAVPYQEIRKRSRAPGDRSDAEGIDPMLRAASNGCCSSFVILKKSLTD